MADSMSPHACSSDSTVSAASMAYASSGEEIRNRCFQLPRDSSPWPSWPAVTAAIRTISGVSISSPSRPAASEYATSWRPSLN
ncbi:hypothetical protein G6F68_019698 [Rhizopus microsporus]|nr:hypothetical protein G6F68_019698 [Rhizopus microsporus]